MPTTAEPIIPPGVPTTREQYAKWKFNISHNQAYNTFDSTVKETILDLAEGLISKHAAYRFLVLATDDLDAFILAEAEAA